MCQLRGRKSGRGLLIGIRNVALIYWCTVIIVYCLFVLLLIYGGAFSGGNKQERRTETHGRLFPDKNINQNLHLAGTFAVGINLIYDCSTIVINAISRMQYKLLCLVQPE